MQIPILHIPLSEEHVNSHDLLNGGEGGKEGGGNHLYICLYFVLVNNIPGITA